MQSRKAIKLGKWLNGRSEALYCLLRLRRKLFRFSNNHNQMGATPWNRLMQQVPHAQQSGQRRLSARFELMRIN